MFREIHFPKHGSLRIMTNNKIITIIAQFILGLIAVLIVYFAGIGNGWELLAMPIGCTIAALLGGRLTGDTMTTQSTIAALVGSGIGAAILLIPIAWGFVGVLLPVIGAVVGYQIANR